MCDNINILKTIKEIDSLLKNRPSGVGDNFTLPKSFIMVYLALKYGLKECVKIGVYQDKGASFLAMTYAADLLGGFVYGIDPFEFPENEQLNIPRDNSFEAKKFIYNINSSKSDSYVRELQKKLIISRYSKIITDTPEISIKYFIKNNIAIDMLVVDSSLDPEKGLENINLYVPLIREKGFVLVENINLDSAKPVANLLKRHYEVIFSEETFAIFYINNNKEELPFLEKRRLQTLYGLVQNYVDKDSCREKSNKKLTISVIILCYNQEKFITDCLEGVFAQRGDFAIELIIGDDCSTDNTFLIIEEYINFFMRDNLQVKVLPRTKNLGFLKNNERCFNACTGDYIAFCEGDDYWIDCYKLYKQVDFLTRNQHCSFCFNALFVKNEITGINADLRVTNIKEVKTESLILSCFIGNFGCCTFNSRYIKKLPTSLFDILTGDWFFCVCCSLLGDIGYLDEVLSVYRKTKNGVWASLSKENLVRKTLELIPVYNKFLNFDCDREYSLLTTNLQYTIPNLVEKCDIAIIDHLFPYKKAGFRWCEFMGYLEDSSLKEKIKFYYFDQNVLFGCFEKNRMLDIVRSFKKEYPQFSKQMERITPRTIIKTKLIYVVFLFTIISIIDFLEESRIPFVFTLYPGGGFLINDAKSDNQLRRIFSSPCFRKVIVNQKTTLNYLLKNKLCRRENIELIFGIPISTIQTVDTITKKRYRFDKQSLDVCFIGHRYSEFGLEKGYDVFISVAKKLCEKYDNIFFHVVGNFDETTLDIKDISNKISFYGIVHIDDFNNFCVDKDVILSPSKKNMVNPKDFDGFPTGSAVEAGVRGVAIICSDELNENDLFINNEEIVIVPPDVDIIIDRMEYFYNNPGKLKDIGEKGSEKIKELYNFDKQILPRINVLREVLKNAAPEKILITRGFVRETRSFTKKLKNTCIRLVSTAIRKARLYFPTSFDCLLNKIKENRKILRFAEKHFPRIINKLRKIIKDVPEALP